MSPQLCRLGTANEKALPVMKARWPPDCTATGTEDQPCRRSIWWSKWYLAFILGLVGHMVVRNSGPFGGPLGDPTGGPLGEPLGGPTGGPFAEPYNKNKTADLFQEDKTNPFKNIL